MTTGPGAGRLYDLDLLRHAEAGLWPRLPRVPGQLLEVKASPSAGLTVRLADVETASRLARALRFGEGHVTTSGGFTRGRWAGEFHGIPLVLFAASSRTVLPVQREGGNR